MSTDSEQDLAESIRALRTEAASSWWRPEIRDRLIERALRLEERLLRLQASRCREAARQRARRPRGKELRQATAAALAKPQRLH